MLKLLVILFVIKLYARIKILSFVVLALKMCEYFCHSTKEEGADEDSSSDNDDDLFENPNHRQIYNYEDSESSTEEEQSDSDTGEEIDTAESNNYGDVEKLQDGIEHLEIT